MASFRTDSIILDGIVITDEGFLKATPIVTRVGVFSYQQLDGTVKRELRPAEEVLKSDSLDSMQMIPITNGHPAQKIVTASTAKELSVGHVGQHIQNDGTFVRAPIAITDQKAINDVRNNGKNQLSLGYTADVIDQKGVYNDQEYDAIQKNIRYNHLAIVHQARAGKEAQIKLDAGDAVQISNSKQEEKVMPNLKVVVIDGIEYEASPEVINALNKQKKSVETLKNDAQSLKVKLDEATVKLDEATAKLDALKQENETLKTRDTEQEIIKASGARTKLLSTVKEVFGDDVFQKVQELPERDIKQIALASFVKCDAKNFDEQSKDYINARFDATVEMAQDKKFANQRAAVHGDNADTTGNANTATAAYDGMMKRLFSNN